jgi:cysteine-S-conjugate beta-lyase
MTKKAEIDGESAHGVEPATLKPDTRLVTGGRDAFAHHGFVNPPVYHASTVLYRTAEDMIAHRGRYVYGRRGTPTTEALENALRDLEGPQCAGVALLPSGLAAISSALLSVLNTADHVLVADNVYRPTRNVCDTILSRFGIATTYYDPLADVTPHFRANTRALFVEAPGSQSFEMPDVPAIAEIARQKGAVVLMDNTWATPLFFPAFEKGVDLSIQAGTKYIVGHSDVMFGTISANAATWPQLKNTVGSLGLCAGPDDVYLALRGLRTMGVRLRRHHESGLAVAHWLEQRPEVLRVLHPGLPSDPGHALWQRDFSGASGLFSIVLKPVSQAAVNALLNALSLFGMGFSWGGYESLVIWFDCNEYRTATGWDPGGPTLRFHIGLEDVSDLTADLERGFAAMAAAR